MGGHKAKSCMLLILVQLLKLQPRSSLAHQPVMAPSNEDQSEGTATSIHKKLPYIVIEENRKLNVVFTSGDRRGQNFQIDLSKIPPPVDNGQPRQLEEETPYPYSFLDGNGNEISEEEYERLSALEIAVEARMEREKWGAKTEGKDRGNVYVREQGS